MGYAWYALGVMFMINVFNYIDRQSIGPAMEHIKRDFIASDFQMGLIVSAFMLVYAVVSLPMGFVSDRGSRTKVIALGAFVWSIATTVSGFMKGFWSFFTMRAIVGTGEGLYAPSGTALISDYFPQSKRNLAISIFMAAMIVGGAISLVVAGIILTKTDHFDIEKVGTLVPYQIEQKAENWIYKGAYETKDRRAAFDFKSSGSDELLTVKLDWPKPEKEADEYTKLFNIHFSKTSGDQAAQLSESDLGFAKSIVGMIRENEGAGLEETRAPLEKMPEGIVFTDEYKDRISYDAAKKELVFKGIMTNEDKKALSEFSKESKYINSLHEIYVNSEYNFRASDNWRWIFWLLGPPGLIFAAMAFFLREPVKGGTENYLSEAEAKKLDSEAKPDIRTLYKTPSLVIMVISNILATFCAGGLMTWLFPYVERFKGIDSSTAAIKMGPIVIVFAVLGVIISGLLADWLFKRTKKGNNIIIGGSLLLAIPFLYIFIGSHNYLVMVASISGCMFFMSMIQGPQNALLMSIVEPKLRATLNAIHILLIHVLGDAISPMIIGYLSDKHDLQYALMIIPVFFILAMIGFFVAGHYVPDDLKRLEERMKKQVA